MPFENIITKSNIYVSSFIYISCKTCGLQYVDSTADRFRLRWNSCNENDRKVQHGEKHIQPELLEHFHLEKYNGFLQNYSIL